MIPSKILGIKTASVLGQEFTIEILSSMLLKRNHRTPETLNNYLLAGEKAGSKLTKAESLGVEVVDEGRFNEMLAG